jgi:hypothetical protein
MYRHDPAAMLYAPLRTVICADADGPTRLVIDRPSTASNALTSWERDRCTSSASDLSVQGSANPSARQVDSGDDMPSDPPRAEQVVGQYG